MAHTVLPVWLLFASYLVIWLWSFVLFPDLKNIEAPYGPGVPGAEKRAWFLLFSAAAVQYFGGSLYTKGVFMLTRLWQGKAVLAALLIPWLLLLTFGREYQHMGKNEPEDHWGLADVALLLFSVCSACLLSGVGILSAGAVTGVCGLWSILRKKQIRAVLPYAAGCIPVLVYGGIYSLIR